MIFAKLGSTIVQLKCPHCGNTGSFTVGSFHLKDGDMELSGVVCHSCGANSDDSDQSFRIADDRAAKGDSDLDGPEPTVDQE